MNNVNFLDLKKNYFSIKDEIHAEVDDLFVNCDFIHGNKVGIFENNFAKYLGINHFIGCANGTDAIEIAIKSLELEDDSEIIVQGNTYLATCTSVISNDNKLVLCDVVPDTFMINVDDLKCKITAKTKILIVVHLYGFMPDMDQIVQLCDENNIILIEDCAQAHGAIWNGKKAGSFGKISCFSFYPGKNLGAYGDGGGIGTNSFELNEKIRKICNLGCKIKYQHELIGRNSRLDTIQAGFLNVKLKHLDNWNEQRRKNAQIYIENLSDIDHIKLPQTVDGCVPVYHLFVIKTEYRDELKKYLELKNVACMIHYPICVSETEAMQKYNLTHNINCSILSKQILSLPMYPEMEEREILYVCSCIKQFFIEKNLVKIKNIETNGKPGILHCINNLSFDCKRFLYFDGFEKLNNFTTEYLDVPKYPFTKRGSHANVNFDEFIVVINGSINIKLIGIDSSVETKIIGKNETYFVPRMKWLEFEILSDDTIIVAMANEILSKSVSVHNFDDFIKYGRENS